MPLAICISVVLGVVLVGCGPAAGSAGLPAVPAMPSAPGRSLSPTAVPTSRSVIEPTAPSVPPTPHTLLVTNAAARHVSFVDPTRGVMSRVEVGAAPCGLALGPDGLAYVATAEGVAIVDIRRQARVAHIPYRAEVGSPAFGEYRAGGMGIAVAPDGRHVYVGVFLPDRSGQLEVIDAVQRTVIASAPIGVRPFQVLVSRDGREVYTIDHDTFTVTVVDARTYTARTLPVQPPGNEGWSSWDKPHYAVVRADGRLLLPFQGETLVDLDPASGEARALPMQARTHQHGVALAPDGRRLLIVGTGPAGGARGEPRLTILDLETQDEDHIPLQRPHEQVALSPDGDVAYLTGGFTFANGGWDGIAIVDLRQETVTELPVPDRPLDIAVLP